MNQPATPPSSGRFLMPERHSNRLLILVNAASGMVWIAVNAEAAPARESKLAAILAKSTSPVNQPTMPPSLGRLSMPERALNKLVILAKDSSGISLTVVKNVFALVAKLLRSLPNWA